MLSRRTRWDAPENRLTAARRARGDDLLDLTESNPTHAGIRYPLEEIAEAFARGAREPYEPDPRGLIPARVALAERIGCTPDDRVITAATIEAYSCLFWLLADPGGMIATPTPSYPLLEHLAALDCVGQQTFPLESHRRWELDVSRIEVTPQTRAIAVIHPNNPTGSFVSAEEQDGLARLGLPIISDEVFLEYPLDGEGATFVRDDALTFTLGGLSKLAGLPQMKLAWIRVGGPRALRREALSGLELIADTFLSVATPVQAALPELLDLAPRIRDEIRARTRANLDFLIRAIAPAPSLRLLPVEGGWSAVIRVPRIESDEELALRLVEQHGVAIHPGYFFDFETEGFLVVSLLTRPDAFTEGVTRLLAAL
jgi:aspartate/methionine/tyrosine aminotransferase